MFRYLLLTCHPSVKFLSKMNPNLNVELYYIGMALNFLLSCHALYTYLLGMDPAWVILAMPLLDPDSMIIPNLSFKFMNHRKVWNTTPC